VEKWRLLAVFNAPVALSRRIFRARELRTLTSCCYVVGVVFLQSLPALATGIVLTRRITRACRHLYRGTQYVQAMDFSHRVQIEKRDQLG